MNNPEINKPDIFDKLSTVLFYAAIFIFIVALAFPHNPAGNWYQQFMPNIGSQQINDITFLDSLTGFAVSSRNVNPDTASILKTTDGGNNWQIVFTQTPKRFSRVQFINSNTGFVCGGSGGGTPQMYKTTNAGANWFLLSGSGCSFWNDMYALSNDTIWLVDANSLCGGVYRTTDSGASWQQQLSGTFNPSKIYMYNARIGFVTNGTNYIRKTTNGGGNWTVTTSGEGFADMYFIDSLLGYKNNGTATIMQKTTDGGFNWQTQNIIPEGSPIVLSRINEFVNVNKDTIWGVGGIYNSGSGNRGMIYKTTNGGQNWGYQLAEPGITIPRYLYTDFINKNHGWAYSTIPTGVHTTNGGNDTTYFSPVQQISSEVPKEYALFQNYPNPFNPKSNIKYQISKSNVKVKIAVFDITGKQIAILVDEEQSAGTYQTEWDASGFASGVYFYSLIIDNKVIETKKMLMVK